MKNTTGRGKSLNGLTNVENACIFLNLSVPNGAKSPDIRRYMYLQRHGSLEGCGTGHYQGYFALPSFYSAGSVYVNWRWCDMTFTTAAQKHDCTKALWYRRKNRWYLTTRGFEVALSAIKKLEKASQCKLG